MARRDPARVVGSETASGGDAVNVGMMLEPLIPGMEHAEEADLRAQVAGIASDLQQGCGTSLEEQVVDHALVLERESREFTRQGEDEVHVAGWAAVPVRVPGASADVRWPGILDNAGCGTSYRRWPSYVRRRNSDRDGRQVRRCGSA
jgi:hypothetical protein